MSMTLTGAIASVLRAISSTLRTLADTGQQVVDFAYVKVLGLPFVVLGYRQTGKTTLLNYLRHNAEYLTEFEPEPTSAGGEAIPTFTTKLDGEGVKLRPKRDVGGEYSMWDTDWIDLLQQAKPRGIVFMIDHEHPYQHKEALNFVLNLIEDEPAARRNLKALLVLINKSDLWAGEHSVEDILEEFRNETRRLKSQSERIGYQYRIAATSLVAEDGIREAMTQFFNSIRPKKREEA
jgi:GTPase SAR1 family protein